MGSSPPYLRGRLWRKAAAFAIALAGVALFSALGLPLPWLLGPIFALLAAALAGARVEGAPVAGAAMRTILGVAIGASITPALAHRLGDMALSLALIPLFLAAIAAVGYPWFRRVWGFDRPTAWYAAMPGGLQDMLAFGEEAGGDIRAISLIQATRVLVIVTALPFWFAYGMGVDLTAPPGAPAADLPLEEGVLMVALALIGWRAARAAGLFGASILGPMIATAAASLAGLIEHRPPAEAILAAQFFIGLAVGERYAGITLAELRRFVLSAIGYSALLAVLTAVFVAIVRALDLAPQVEAMLAFSPGGQAEMAVVAIIAGADIAYVVAHHILRMVLIIIGAPLVIRARR